MIYLDTKTPRPFLPYFGSKWRNARRYPAPEHPIICEPFAGGAGYSLNYTDRRVLLVDKYPVIVGVWRYLINVTETEFRSLPLVHHVDDAHVCEEAKNFIGYWLGKGSYAPRAHASSWMVQYPDRLWGAKVRDALASQLDMIRHWEAREASYEDLGFVDGVTWFVDPPYTEAGRGYPCGSRSLDYTQLGAWCRQQKGQVIVCENAGASWLPFRDAYTLNHGLGRGKRSIEVIWP